MTTEIIQLNVPERSGEFTDVLIDYGGYLLGAFLVGLVLFLVIRHQRKKRGNS
jgi:VanZ family protein